MKSLAFALAVVAVSGTAFAQNTPNQQAAPAAPAAPAPQPPASQPAAPGVVTPPPAPTPVPPDPATQKFIDDVKKTYAGFKTYRCQFAVRAAEKGPDGVTGVVAYAAPNKAKVLFKIEGRAITVIMDGNNIFHLVSPKQYVKTPDAKDGAAFRAMMEQSPSLGDGILAHLLTGGELPPFAGTYLLKSTDKSDVLEANRNAPGRSLTVTLEFEKTTHLFKSAVISATGPQGNIYNATTFSGIQGDPVIAPATFTFKPAPGMKLITPPAE